MFTALRSKAAAFSRDEDGVVAVTFGLAVVTLMIAVGVAVDFGRMHHARTQLAAAVDAAALAGGRAMLDGRMSTAEIRALALATFKHNLENGSTDFGQPKVPQITLDRKSGEVRVEATANVPMTVSAITGTTERPVGARATVSANAPDLEVALAIDVTSSMGWGNKLQDLKDATEEFLDIILPDEGVPNSRRVALAPFSSGVNAGPLADELLEDTTQSECTFERDGSGDERVSDTIPPKDSLIQKILAFLKNLIGGSGGYANRNCPDVTVQPLTDDKDLLLSQIRSYTAMGTTAGHLGAQWSSYLLSPKWANILGPGGKPAKYDPNETVKVAIIMTDGINNTYAGSVGDDYSSETDQSNQHMIEICQAMRAEDRKIKVYTIGFQLDSQDARDVLRECAGSEKNALFAENGVQLIEAYQEIAKRISKLRITS